MKKLLFTAALLAPGLAYAGQPSTDLSVQFVSANVGDMVIGVSIGLLIGVVSALKTYLLLSDTDKQSTQRPPWLRRLFGGKSPVSGFRVAVKISALPVFWFGGSWLTSCLMNNIDYWIVGYVPSLALTYCLLIWPAIGKTRDRLLGKRWEIVEHKA
jgi:hypothetical protein